MVKLLKAGPTLLFERRIPTVLRKMLPMITLLLISMNASAEVVGNKDEGVHAVAEPMLESLMQGYNKNDYSLYSRYFSEDMKKAITEESFSKVRSQLQKQIGNLVSRKYLGFLNRQGMTTVLWKARFDKTKDDILIKLVVSKKGDKNYVEGLWFQ